jgi:predicted GNAT family acetyltransferase
MLRDNANRKMSRQESTHLLDHPIWHALNTVHAGFAQGDGLAKRYPAEIGPLAALREQSEEAYRAMGELLGANEPAVFFLDSPPRLAAGWRLVKHSMMDQMVCTSFPKSIEPDHEWQELTREDVPEMIELATLTEPGPFRSRTIEFGGYLGIRKHGRLAAMTGRRLHLQGWTEVSAVCTHPDFRGHGYAAALVQAVARGIFARGETPFLEVRQENLSAKRLYERLGFVTRRQLHLAVVLRPA